MALDMTTFAAGLKVHYTPEMVQNLVYRDNPLLSLLPKYEKFGGQNLPIPIIYGNPQGRSGTFTNAQSNKTSTKIKAFTLTRQHDYSVASIDNETIEASMGDANAFMEAATTEIDGALQAVSRSLAIKLYRNGSGSVAQVSNSSYATTALTLVNINDVVNFEVGQTLTVGPNDSSTSLRSGTLTITAVDRIGGGITTSQNLSTGIAAIAQNDYIFVQGDASQAITGLLGWLPGTVSATSFFGVDRTLDSVRLGGVYSDGRGKSIEEALIDAATLTAREGGKITHCFMNYSNYGNLEKALGSKVQYIDLKQPNQDFGFRGIQLNGPRGTIQVIPDQNCQSSYAWMLQMDMWKLYSLGAAPKILDTDGLKMLRDSSADSVEVRCGYYAQLGCRAPGFNAQVQLA